MKNRIKGKETIYFFKVRIDSKKGNIFDRFDRIGQVHVFGAILKRVNKEDMTWSSNSTEHDALLQILKEYGRILSKISLKIYISHLKKSGILLPLSSRGTYKINPFYVTYGKEDVYVTEAEEKIGVSTNDLPY